MSIIEIDTDHVPVRERFGYWRETMRTLLGADTQEMAMPFASDGFRARMSCRPRGRVVCIDLSGSSFSMTLPRSRPAWAGVAFQIEGASHMWQDHRKVSLSAGDLCLYGAGPMRFMFEGPFRVFLFKMKESAIAETIPWQITMHPLADPEMPADVFLRTMLPLLDQDKPPGRSIGESIEECLFGMLLRAESVALKHRAKRELLGRLRPRSDCRAKRFCAAEPLMSHQ